MRPNWRTIAPLILFLGACAGVAQVERLGLSPFWFEMVAPKQATAFGGAISIRGPEGYCVDSRATRREASGVFVLLGSCASLANSNQAGRPRSIAMLTASASSASPVDISNSADALASHLQSSDGRTQLARDGMEDSIDFQSVTVSDGVVLLRASDKSIEHSSNVDQTFWRAFTNINGHNFALSVYELDGKRLTEAGGQQLLLDFVTALRNANGASALEPGA